MKASRWWKSFYAAERSSLGERGLLALLERAPPVALPPGGALVFPHARLSGCGAQVAAVARALLDTGADEVLALGVLHGGREQDAALVKKARGGDAESSAALRRVHEDGENYSTEEFSLDNLAAMIETLARARGVRPPRILGRYPFLVGDRVDDLPGLDELEALVERGLPVVATADHVHHGAGYGVASERCLPAAGPAAASMARRSIDASFELLRLGNLPGFRRFASDAQSDFRDVGPVLAALMPAHGPRDERSAAWDAHVHALELVGYADVLECADPTWVAAALIELRPDPSAPPPQPLGRCG